MGVSGYESWITLHTPNYSINAYSEAVASVKLANDVTYRR